MLLSTFILIKSTKTYKPCANIHSNLKRPEKLMRFSNPKYGIGAPNIPSWYIWEHQHQRFGIAAKLVRLCCNWIPILLLGFLNTLEVFLGIKFQVLELELKQKLAYPNPIPILKLRIWFPNTPTLNEFTWELSILLEHANWTRKRDWHGEIELFHQLGASHPPRDPTSSKSTTKS